MASLYDHPRPFWRFLWGKDRWGLCFGIPYALALTILDFGTWHYVWAGWFFLTLLVLQFVVIGLLYRSYRTWERLSASWQELKDHFRDEMVELGMPKVLAAELSEYLTDGTLDRANKLIEKYNAQHPHTI